MAVIMSCVWTMADEVCLFVRDLAAKNELVFFDPQAGIVLLPGAGRKQSRPLLAKRLLPALQLVGGPILSITVLVLSWRGNLRLGIPCFMLRAVLRYPFRWFDRL